MPSTRGNKNHHHGEEEKKKKRSSQRRCGIETKEPCMPSSCEKKRKKEFLFWPGPLRGEIDVL